jgi:iron complex outermembrane receptor protein
LDPSFDPAYAFSGFGRQASPDLMGFGVRKLSGLWVEDVPMKHSIPVVSCLVFFLLSPLPLFAQEKEVTLEEVVVTATRDFEEVRKVPASVTVITKEEIEQSNARAPVDLLRDEVGIVVRDFYGNGKTATVDIRGFGETAPLNTLVLVDGRRVNEIDLSGVDWTQIPLDQIERIEIVRGSGSVLYGDNAVGGVINIITKRPEKPFSFQAGVALGSYSYHNETGSVSGKWGPLSAILGFNYHGTDGYRDNGLLRGKDVGGNILYDVNEDISLNLSGSLHSDKTGLPGGLTSADIDRLGRRGTTNPDDNAETDDGYGALGLKAGLGDFGEIRTDLSYRRREVKDFFPSSSFQDVRKISTWGFIPSYLLEKPLGSFKNKLTLGLDYYRADSDNSSESAFGPNESDVKKTSVGLYAYDEFSILDDLLLSLGFRNEWVTYDLFQVDPFLEDTVRDQKPAWNAGLDYLYGKGSSVFLSYKRSFRFPASDELVQFVFIPPNLTARVNPDMKPQTGDHYEAGIRHVFNDRVEVNLTFFWIDMKDEIFFNPQTFTNENFPKTRRQGIEAGARAKLLSWLSVWANYGYTRPLLRDDPFEGNDIPAVPRNKGALGVDIEAWNGFLFSARGTAVGSRYLISDFANRSEKLDPYYTVDLKVSYTWKGLSAFFGVNNLFNDKYSEFGVFSAFGPPVFYPSPERNFVGGLSYTF